MKIKSLLNHINKQQLIFEDAEGRMYYYSKQDGRELLISVVSDGTVLNWKQFEENLQHVNYLYYNINRIRFVESQRNVYENIDNVEYFKNLEVVWERWIWKS